MPTIREIAGLPVTPANLSESALIMIDCQNTYRDGIMQLEGVEEALQNASQLLQRARVPQALLVQVRVLEALRLQPRQAVRQCKVFPARNQ